MKKTSNDLPIIIETYFSKHLTFERRFSQNTYKTYLMIIKQFLDFSVNELNIKKIDLSISTFTKDNLLSFLRYVEDKERCSPKTRNHKLTVINSFLEYASTHNPVYLNIYTQAKSIKFKKVVKKKMDFMTIVETKAFFDSIDLKHKNGYKHYVLLTILYETAARVSELINLTTDNLFLSGTGPYIKILGKGNKERIVYVSDNVVKMIKEYQGKFNIGNGYLFLNHSNEQYSRFGINKLIDKYIDLAKKECSTLCNKTVTPHTFRHSKAVHFLQNGTALPIIQRFLGHSSIQTTEIYLDITNDVVIEAVNTAANLISGDDKPKALWVGDDELVALLDSLK